MATCSYVNEPSTSQGQSCDSSSIVVNKALLARIEFLESELAMCRSKLSSQQSHFRIADIAEDNSLVSFYTGFSSYDVFLCFFEFLGPSVHSLRYWGDKSDSKGKRKKTRPNKPVVFDTN